MIRARRFVFDASTLLGAVLRPRSVPRQAFRAALSQGVLCASPATLAELERVPMRSTFAMPIGSKRNAWSFCGTIATYYACFR
jgi:hypothetical protein